MKTLKTFEFTAAVGTGASYEWDKILSGDIVQLDAGKDFECKPATFCTLARSAAKKRKMIVRTSMLPKDRAKDAPVTGVVLQAQKASKEQLAKWAEAEAAAETEETTEE